MNISNVPMMNKIKNFSFAINIIMVEKQIYAKIIIKEFKVLSYENNWRVFVSVLRKKSDYLD